MLNVSSGVKSFILAFIATIIFNSSAHAADLSVSSVVPNLETMLLNFATSVPNLMRLVTAGAYVIGIFFIIAAVIGMRHFGEMRTMMAREHSIMGPLVELLVGAALIYLPSSVEAGLNTFWQTTNPYAYLNSSETGEAASFVTAAYSVVQLIGTIAFIRGLLMLKAAGSERGGQPGMLGKALAHMGGGILCINIYNTLQVLEKTVGLAN